VDKKEHKGKKPYKRGRSTYESRRLDTYRAWRNMLARCLDERHHGYSYYGGRGIKVHLGWIPKDTSREAGKLAFEAFVSSVGIRPSISMSLERMDVDGNYEPGNVKWADKVTQSNNKRGTVKFPDPEDPTKMIAAKYLAMKLGISYSKLRYQLMSEGKWPNA